MTELVEQALTRRLPLSDFPVLRSRSANDACSRIGRLLSPHRLEVRGRPGALQVELNEVVLCDLSVRTLRYGTEVTIDPGRRGDHYLMQLPLRGRADVRCGANQVASDTVVRSDERCLRRAKDYIHAHLNQALLLDDIARAACTSPRTLEAVFKRHEATSPLNYARTARLQALHDTLRKGEGRSVTDVALSHGFVHMGRFAAQYRRQFGCPPSQTWRSAQ